MLRQKGKQDGIGLEKHYELYRFLSGSQQGAISHAFESPQSSALRSINQPGS